MEISEMLLRLILRSAKGTTSERVLLYPVKYDIYLS
jgi:hypothetical protein